MSRGRKRNSKETGFEEWGGYMAAKISKLENQFQDEVGKERKGIFNGIAIFVNGYTDPTAEELKKIMINYGGTFHHYYSRRRTTHIIASNLPNSKIINKNTDYIVSPKWISESLSAGCLLDYRKYLLYTSCSKTQPKLSFNIANKEITGTEEVKNAPGPSAEQNFVLDDVKKINENVEVINLSPELFTDDDSIIKMQTDSCLKMTQDSVIDKEKDSLTIETKRFTTTMSEDCNKKIPKDSSSKSTNISRKNLSNTNNPSFLTDFYNNSRLHHISTAGAMFKQYVKEIQTRDDTFEGHEFLLEWKAKNNYSEEYVPTEKIFMHIDMDCFFVSVGLKKYPELRNLPVAVTHAKNTASVKRNDGDMKYELNVIKERHKDNDKRNVFVQSDVALDTAPKRLSTFDLLDENSSMAEIASCSYEARQKGVKNGTFLGAALKLCPDLRTIPYDFDGYKAVSMDLYDTVASYTKEIEAVSCDEMFVDITSVLKSCKVSPLCLSSCLREQIQSKTQCPCSVGMGPNMLVARLATKKAKPNGQCWIETSYVEDFMKDQNVSNLPGVGWSLKKRLGREGIVTCTDLQKNSLKNLQKLFGVKTGKSLYDFSRGLDERTISRDHQRKSVSAEVNYGIRFETWKDAEKFLLELSEEVSSRLNQICVVGRTITLKLKVRAKDAPVETAKFMGHGLCDNVAKSVTLHTPSDDALLIYRDVLTLVKQMSISPSDLRGIGIQVSKLEDKTKAKKNTLIESFFAETKPSTDKKKLYLKKVAEINLREPANENSSTVHSDQQTVFQQSTVTTDVQSLSQKENATENSISSNKSSSTDVIIDMTVLKELPLDLQKQIINEYKALGYKVEDSKFKEEANKDPQPGPSRILKNQRTKPDNLGSNIEKEPQSSLANDPKLLLNGEERIHKMGQPGNDITSFSQIDQSFLNALPEDLKEEVKLDFELKRRANDKRKKFIDKHSKSRIGTGKQKRGRPKGTSNKSKGAQKKPLVQKISQLSSPKGEVTKESTIGKETESSSEPLLRTNVEVIEPKSYKNSPPHFCGESELPQIKTLIGQWIQSCQNPDSYDSQLIIDFCKNLIYDKDLEKLDLILKFLHRKLTRNAAWKICFEEICETVQTIMLRTHDAILAVHFV